MNDQSFSREYIDEYLAQNLPAEGATPEQRAAVIENLVNRELLAHAARREGLDRVLATRVAVEHEMRLRLGAAYQQRLADVGLLEQEARAAYEKEPGAYRSTVRDLAVVVVFVRVAGEGTPVDQEQAQSRIQAAYAALQKGVPFAEVVREYSEDPVSRKNDGRLGPVPPERLPTPAAREAADLVTGRYSRPIRNPHSFMIVQALSDLRDQVKPFEQVKQEIVGRLATERQAEALKRLRQEATIRVDASLNAPVTGSRK